MIILAVNIGQKKSQISLFNDLKLIDRIEWLANRQLIVTLNLKIKEILSQNNLKLNNLEGLIGFIGPGSFTGLRISLSVLNALAYGLKIPIVGSQDFDQRGLEESINKLLNGQNEFKLQPIYSDLPKINQPKK